MAGFSAAVTWLLAMPASCETTIVKEEDYLLAIPGTQKTRPLLVSLHGTDDKPSHALNAWLGAARGSRIFLLCPAPAGKNWEPSNDQPRIHKLIQQIIRKHRIDPRRIYLTGFSSGATMAGILVLSKTTKFAAVLLNSGHYPADLEIPSGSSKLAIHILHGGKDGAFPPAEARRHAKRLRDFGLLVSYTELRGMGHNYVSGKQAPEMLAWLMCFRTAK